MTIHPGARMHIQIADPHDAESYLTLGGMQLMRMEVRAEPVRNSHVGSGPWQGSAHAAGMREVRITGNGMFTDTAAETHLREHIFDGTSATYRMVFGNGDVLHGPFQIEEYIRDGRYDGEERYNVTFSSAGSVTYLPSA